MKSSRLPVAIMLLIVVAIGVALVRSASAVLSETPRQTPTASPTLVPTPNPLNTTSLLLISVKAFDAPQRELESLTVIKYKPVDKTYYGIVVSPATLVSDENAPAKTIQSIYDEETSRLQYQAPITQKALQKISPELGGLYATIDFDRQALVETFNQLEPFECLGKPQTGQGLLDQYNALNLEALEQRRDFQGTLLLCLLEGARQKNWDFATLIDTLQRHTYRPSEVVNSFLEAAPALSASKFVFNSIPLDPPVTSTP